MNKGKIAVLAVSMLFLGGYSANAAVINVSPDANPGDTNLQDAIGTAHNGDVLVLAAGAYTEEITIDSFKRLTLRGAGAATTKIDGAGGSGSVVTITNSKFVTLNNLSVVNGAADNILVDTSKHIKFLSVNSDNAVAHGAELDATVDTVIQNCEFTNNGYYGLYYINSNYEFKIINNLMDNNNNDGLRLYDVTHGLVFRNTLTNNGVNGLYLEHGNSVKIVTNLADGNGSTGIVDNGYAYTLIKGNTATNNGYDGIWAYGSDLIFNNYVAGNTVDGIEARDGCLIKHNIADQNGNAGIYGISRGVSAINNLSTGNSGRGIRTSGFGRAVGNKTLNNGFDGIYNSGNVFLIMRNFADSNTWDGIAPYRQGVVTKNNRSTNNGQRGIFDDSYGCTTNNNLAMNNTDDGISAQYQDVYFRNRVIGNGGDGFYLESDSNFIRNNVALNNSQHGVNASGVHGNLVRANTVKGNGDGVTWFDLYESSGTQNNFYEHNRYDTKNFSITY